MRLPFGTGVVNAYLRASDHGFILIDTGSANQREELTQALEGARCGPGSLKLIVLTHGDLDHAREDPAREDTRPATVLTCVPSMAPPSRCTRTTPACSSAEICSGTGSPATR